MTTAVDALDRRLAPARQVADTVVYEGYVLYPYRASAAKNQIRWQFGVVAPRRWVEAHGGEAWSNRTEVVVDGGRARMHLRVRFLQVQGREVECPDGAGGYTPVAELSAGGQVWASFDEAVEHTVDLVDVDVAALVHQARTVPIELPADRQVEDLVVGGAGVGRVVRRRWPLTGRVVVSAQDLEGPYPLRRVSVEVHNVTAWDTGTSRKDLVRRSLCAVHLLGAVDGGRWVSSLEPPKFASEAVAGCRSEGTFPVLVGDDDLLLSSPIILYDHPAIAPESEGDMFDATEIDEILALRVMTLTDEEKREARGTDPRSAAIIDRCEAMGVDALSALHGTFRQMRMPAAPEGRQADTDGAVLDEAGADLPWWEPAVDASFDPWSDTVPIGDADVGQGTHVRLHPSRRSDAQDVFLDGLTAMVAGVFHDVDDDVFVAVVVDDDPAAEMHQWHGRYLYFHPDEVEVLR